MKYLKTSDGMLHKFHIKKVEDGIRILTNNYKYNNNEIVEISEEEFEGRNKEEEVYE